MEGEEGGTVSPSNRARLTVPDYHAGVTRVRLGAPSPLPENFSLPLTTVATCGDQPPSCQFWGHPSPWWLQGPAADLHGSRHVRKWLQANVILKNNPQIDLRNNLAWRAASNINVLVKMFTRRLFFPAYRHSNLLPGERLHVLVFLWSAWKTLDPCVLMCGWPHCAFNGELSYNTMFQKKSYYSVLSYLGITTMWYESISRIGSEEAHVFQ